MATATPDRPATLKETADREADAVDQELAAQEETTAGDPFPNSRPGEQGSATQEEEPEAYEAPEPTQAEIGLADDVYLDLQNRARDMGDVGVINALIGIVDVHARLRTPEIFGSNDSDRDIYHEADNVAEIARFLCAACPKLEVSHRLVAFYFKDHEKWTSAGQKVHGQVKRFDGFMQHHLEGMLAAVVINYHLWKTQNPRQKIFTVYHLLREMDEKGKRRAPDWVGYFEEPGLFGAGVHEEMVRMAQSFVQDAKVHVGEVHQLSILAGVYDGD